KELVTAQKFFHGFLAAQEFTSTEGFVTGTVIEVLRETKDDPKARHFVQAILNGRDQFVGSSSGSIRGGGESGALDVDQLASRSNGTQQRTEGIASAMHGGAELAFHFVVDADALGRIAEVTDPGQSAQAGRQTGQYLAQEAVPVCRQAY